MGLYAQDVTFVEIDELESTSELIYTNKNSLKKVSSEAFTITYDNSLLIPRKQTSSPDIWDINKSITNSYLNKSLFADNAPIDIDAYFWDQSFSNKAVFALDPIWERIIFGNSNQNELKSYGDHAGEYEFSYPQALTVDNNGYVYVTDTGTGKIIKLQYNPASNTLTHVSTFTIPGMKTPSDIIFFEYYHYDGRPPMVLVMDRETSILYGLTLDGQVFCQIDQYEYQGHDYNLDGIDRISKNAFNGNIIYLLDNMNKRVIKVIINSGSSIDSKLFSSGVIALPRSSYITDIGTDCFFDIYLSDSYNNCLHKISYNTFEYLGSYNEPSIVNNPQRITSSSIKVDGYILLDFYYANAWSENYGVRRFLPGCNLNNLNCEKSGSDCKIQYQLTSRAQLYIEVYRNGIEIKNEEVGGLNYSGFHEYELSGAELGIGEINVKMKYKPYSDDAYSSEYQQGWQYKEVTFSTTNISASISGPRSLLSGQTGNFTVSAYGGNPPYHYQWYYRYPGGLAKEGRSLKKPPSGYWYTLGTDSPNLSRSDDETFELKCTVSDSQGSTPYTTPIHTVTINGGAIKAPGAEEITTQLFSNYPNPFNPTTTIKYSLKDKSHVSLKVFDVIGREVAELVNKVQITGEYSVEFNAGNLPSGIYIYRLTANNERMIGKMILAK